ncbi:MAG: PD-(D/E)XK nuclease family transposase [Huintestinicola sp.]
MARDGVSAKLDIIFKKLFTENRRKLWLQFINADSEEELEMISQTNVPIMQKAVNVIYDMSEDTKIREIARLREKALHDEASAIKNAKAEERNDIISKLKAYGITDEQIKAALS